MSAETAPSENQAAKALLPIEEALASRSETGEGAPPMPSSTLEALKIAYLSGDVADLAQAIDKMKSASTLPNAEGQTAIRSAAIGLIVEDRAAELISEIRQAIAKIENLESGQRRIADELSALDKHVRELEACLRATKAD